MSRKIQEFIPFAFSGDWQLHTNVTDGKSSIQDYFECAKRKDLKFILFSEHVRKQTTYDYLKFKEEVYRVGSRYNIKFSVGAEAKVLNIQGDLDISEEISKEAEIVLFAYHTKLFHNTDTYIESLYNISKNPIADIWAHPTSYENWMGFIIKATDYDSIFSAFSFENKVIELNKRYPLPSLIFLESVAKHQIKVVFGSDAHHCEELLNLTDRRFFETILKYSKDENTFRHV